MKRALSILIMLLILVPSISLAQTTIDPSVNRHIKPQQGLTNNPVIPGESMTTGLPSDGTYIPILVNIDNVQGAWPQWGISKADIIYEMPIHGLGLTRLMALFSHDHPASVGPVRSGRVMHAEMREEWDAGWVYVGVQEKEGSDVNSVLRKLEVKEKTVNLLFNGNTNKWGSYFEFIDGYNSPHNHGAPLDKFAEVIKDYTFPQRPFLFADTLPTSGDTATSIHLAYGTDGGSYSNSSYTYDPGQNTYARFRQNKPYEDRDQPGIPLTFSNVIVQWTKLQFNGAANAPLLTLVGKGNADIFMGGKHIAGYWVRESMESRTVFYDQDGQEIRLQRGKTFINITADRSTKVSYE